MLTVDQRFELSKSAFVSAPSKGSFSSVSSPILACSDFDGCLLRSGPAAGAERIGGLAFKLSLPRRDLIRMHVELLS